MKLGRLHKFTELFRVIYPELSGIDHPSITLYEVTGRERTVSRGSCYYEIFFEPAFGDDGILYSLHEDSEVKLIDHERDLP